MLCEAGRWTAVQVARLDPGGTLTPSDGTAILLMPSGQVGKSNVCSLELAVSKAARDEHVISLDEEISLGARGAEAFERLHKLVARGYRIDFETDVREAQPYALATNRHQLIWAAWPSNSNT